MEILGFGAILAAPPIVAAALALFAKDPRWSAAGAGLALVVCAGALVVLALSDDDSDTATSVRVAAALFWLLAPLAVSVLVVTARYAMAAPRPPPG